MRRLLTLIVCASMVACALAGVEQEHLKLYASFDTDAAPEIARDGFRLVGGTGVRPKSVDGRYAGALHFCKAAKTVPLVYRPGPGFGTNGWTVAFWIRMDEEANARYGQTDFSRGIFSTNGGQAHLGGVRACMTCWLEFVTDAAPALPGKSSRTVFSSRAIPAKSWTHLAFVFHPNGTNDIYINGNPAACTEKNAVRRLFPVERLRVGAVWKETDALDGAMDELKVFDTALSSLEVKETLASLPLRKTADIALYLPCDGEIAGRGVASFSAVDLVFAPGVSSDGVKIVRHGYDRRAILSVQGGETNAPVQSFFAYFTPDWPTDEPAPTRHGLWLTNGRTFSTALEKNAEGLVYTITSAGRTSQVVLPKPPLKKGVCSRLAAGYDWRAGRMFVSADGVRREAALDLPQPADLGAVSLTLGDVRGADVYSKTQAEGTFDEVLVAREWLSGEELAEVVATEIVKKGRQTVRTIVHAPVTDREASLWDLAPAERMRTATRERITLNALWRCQLTDAARPFNPRDWSYLPVPGRYAGQENGGADCAFFFRDRHFRKVNNALYDGRETFKFSQAWFERAFKADPAWKGRSIVLEVDELSPSQSGQVFLNRRLLGWLLGGGRFFELPIPEYMLAFEGWNFLCIQTSDAGRRWDWRGVKGDVTLRISDRIHAETPELATSVQKGELAASVRLANGSARAERLTVEAEITGCGVRRRLVFDPVLAHPGETVTVKSRLAWPDAKPWDVDAPNLYSCVFRVRDAEGRLRDELAPEKFGFREFAIDGRDFRLNGKKIHLFIHDQWVNMSEPEDARRTARLFKSLGYNAIRMDFSAQELRNEVIMDACDAEGLLYFPNLGGVAGREYALWSDPSVRSALEARMRTRIERWRNHACAVMWYTSINFLGYAWDYHPLKIADGYVHAANADKARVCEEGVAFIRKYDAAQRPWFFQAGGCFGPVHTSNAYFCWWPQTERAAWPEEWAKIGTKPLVPIETSFPYVRSFYGMDLQNPGTKPLFFFENLARFYGPAAYTIDDPDMRLETQRSAHGNEAQVWYDAPGLQRLKSDLLKDTLQHWRGFDLSGICPFSEINYAFGRHAPRHSRHVAKQTALPERDFRRFGPTPDARKYPYQSEVNDELPLPTRAALARSFAPEFAFFDGGAQEPVDRQVSYRAGERLEKRLVLINDRRQALTYSGSWRLGEATGTFSENLSPGQIVRIPVSLTLPVVPSDTKLVLTADVKGSSPISVDPIEILVRPSPTTGDLPAIPLFDTVGRTAARLKALGVPTLDVTGSGDVKGPLLVIGTESLNEACSAMARTCRLAERVGTGDLTVLVLAQKPEALAGLGLRTTPVYAREAFDQTGARIGPWAGRGLLAPEKIAPDPAGEKWIPRQFYHWNNQNIICSYPLLRPSEGQHAVRLACGKDLVYTPLVEMASGKGRIVFCQLEIETRSLSDVAADTLLVSLLREYTRPRPDRTDLPVQIVDAARAKSFGIATTVANVSELAVSEVGRTVFPDLTARDLFLRRPFEMTVFAGTDVIPLLEPAVVAEKREKGRRLVFVGLPAEPACAEERARAAAAGKGAPSTSWMWSAEIVENRLRSIRAHVERAAGVIPSNVLAERFAQPLARPHEAKDGRADSGSPVCPYSFNRSTYHTEQHVRW